MKKLLAAALLLALALAPAWAGQPTPLTPQIDRTQDPSPVCLYRSTTGQCDPIGTLSSSHGWVPRLPPGTAPAHQFQTGADANGVATFGRPTMSDILNAAPVASSGSASDLGTGTLPVGRMPALAGGDCASSAGSGSLLCSLLIKRVGSTAELTAVPVTLLTTNYRVRRTGRAAANDGMPAVDYYLTGAACTLNGGAGDGGAEVPAAISSNCWKIAPQAAWDPTWWGARADLQAYRGTITTTNGSGSVTAANNIFAATDVGKKVSITDIIGDGTTSAGSSYQGTITGYTSPTQVTVSPAVGFAVPAAADARTTKAQYVNWGTDDSAALNAMDSYVLSLAQTANVFDFGGRSYALAAPYQQQAPGTRRFGYLKAVSSAGFSCSNGLGYVTAVPTSQEYMFYDSGLLPVNSWLQTVNGITRIHNSTMRSWMGRCANTSATISTTMPTITVSGITESGTTATATVSDVGPLVSGQSFTLSGENVSGYNATWIVSSIPNQTTVVFTATASLGTATGGTLTYGSPVVKVTPASLSTLKTLMTSRGNAALNERSSIVDIEGAGGALASLVQGTGSNANTVTATLSSGTTLGMFNGTDPTVCSAARPCASTSNVVIAGAAPSAFNGTFAVTGVIDATHFTYKNAASSGSATTPGTATNEVCPSNNCIVLSRPALSAVSAVTANFDQDVNGVSSIGTSSGVHMLNTALLQVNGPEASDFGTNGDKWGCNWLHQGQQSDMRNSIAAQSNNGLCFDATSADVTINEGKSLNNAHGSNELNPTSILMAAGAAKTLIRNFVVAGPIRAYFMGSTAPDLDLSHLIWLNEGFDNPSPNNVVQIITNQSNLSMAAFRKSQDDDFIGQAPPGIALTGLQGKCGTDWSYNGISCSGVFYVAQQPDAYMPSGTSALIPFGIDMANATLLRARRRVKNISASTTIDSFADCGTTFNSTATTGTVTITLPRDVVMAGGVNATCEIYASQSASGGTVTFAAAGTVAALAGSAPSSTGGLIQATSVIDNGTQTVWAVR